MMTAIKAALAPSDDQSHIRIVCFMTDGYVGNDMEIISEIQKHQNARVFSFGIGNGANRFLLDKIAEVGRGEVEYVTLVEDGSAAARRFHDRIRNPLLTDISIDWNGLPVADVYPQRIPDLFGAKPVIVTGRFSNSGRATIRLKGKMAGSDFVREIPVEFPETMASHDVLAPLWARARIDSLMGEDYLGAQRGTMRAGLEETITQLGIEYRLMTQFTSFVAVEEMIVTDGGQPRRIDVPVEVPAGVDRRMVSADVETSRAYTFGLSSAGLSNRASAPPAKAVSGAGAGGGVGVGRRIAPKPVSAANAPDDSPEFVGGEVRQKLHASLFAVVERLKNKQTLPTADEAKFVRNGKAEVQIWLTDKSAETLAKLKELGVEVVLDAKNSNIIIGRLPIDKLETLSTLKFVRYVAPQVSR
jgi:Ca-activated chloride channel family protein